MKRFHVHVHVEDLARNIAFYSAMFGARPSRVEADYAKWMLDEPAVNFAISTRGHGALGVDHLGIQVDSEDDLATMKAQAQSADIALVDAGATTCCYARSDKHWIVDPQGLAWEHFRTLGGIPVFSEGEPVQTGVHADLQAAAVAPEASACCAPRAQGKPVEVPVKPASGGCC